MELELITPMQEPPAREPFWKRLAGWLLERGKQTFHYDTPLWRFAIIGLWVACSSVLMIAALGMPTGIGVLFDCTVAVLLGTIVTGAAGIIGAYALTLCYVPLPRLTLAFYLSTGALIWYVCDETNIGNPLSIILAACMALIGAAVGLVIGTLASKRAGLLVKFTVIVAVTLSGLSFNKWPMNQPQAVPAAALADAADQPAEEVELLDADDPSERGLFRVRSFTYGSGIDTRRDEYGSNVMLTSNSVDASAYIKRWNWMRSFFWGFDQEELPVNGRVWMPEEKGKYPLVLLVHGNHLMEQFSDGGYAYLGELLASRGFIAVSVDENFLNYSVWGNIPNNDFKVRAWMLLKHLQQITAYSEQQGNPFYQSVDLQKVALIGHSRGGQAVAMAADWTKWFADDKSLTGLKGIGIQAVIGIAPTDTNVDKKKPQLRDKYYLSLQGASDGDVDTFNGERQYIRSSFSPDSERFKATLYIGEANHSRFNTDWGTMDDSLPGGLLLRNSDMMPAEDQRQVAEVYVSAFLEAALHGKKEYQPLFADYRTGASWLPEATYMNRYEDGSFIPLARAEEDYRKETLSSGAEAKAEHLQWTEEAAKDRDNNDKGSRGVALQWKQGDGSYTLELSEAWRDKLRGEGQQLLFSMTNLERALVEKQDAGTDEGPIPLPAIEVELQSRDGAAVRLPLSMFKAVTPLPYTTFTWFPWMEKKVKNGKYKVPTEAVFQTYSLPLERFEAANPDFEAAELSRVTFYFTSSKGKVMLDDIGFSDAVNDVRADESQ
ncbi:chlorophyllase/cutinase-like alpha/beta fold protein [Paenibacillus montanisoli]|uniref:Alpha/beta hydrolase n=1 Tax=Paenibacillus montanisoli TaxID=2081970 RepID=A0A328U6S9_9BACL|nr:alpha/beta hydrolase [Paenibacillus montanisoli]RAP77802.1 alpha/beta hydrolase [Paenibacillus montanisoli]